MNNIVTPSTGISGVFKTTEGNVVSFSPSKAEKGEAPQPAPNPTTNTTTTISVTAAPVDPTFSHSTPLTMDLGYVVLIGLGAYAIGRIHQFFKDSKRGMGPKLPGGGNRD